MTDIVAGGLIETDRGNFFTTGGLPTTNVPVGAIGFNGTSTYQWDGIAWNIVGGESVDPRTYLWNAVATGGTWATNATVTNSNVLGITNPTLPTTGGFPIAARYGIELCINYYRPATSVAQAMTFGLQAIAPVAGTVTIAAALLTVAASTLAQWGTLRVRIPRRETGFWNGITGANITGRYVGWGGPGQNSATAVALSFNFPASIPLEDINGFNLLLTQTAQVGGTGRADMRAYSLFEG